VPPRSSLLAVAVAATACLLAGACGDDDEEGGEAEVGPATELERGDISVSGDVGEDPTITIAEAYEAPTGLIVDDLVEGDGDEVPAGATVTVHYEGVLTDGSVFDSSFGGQPATFPLDGVIQGWTEGIPGMKVGGRRLLQIPPDLAYGAGGFPPAIGPDEPLVFVVDMVGVQ
jgi:peptidylprolyl isomerase